MSHEVYTLMAVHAHPDDESSGTGGLLRLAAMQGHTTVLVTCTNGELGEVKARGLHLDPLKNPADGARLAAIRREELARAASILAITHLHMLGYHDSGMAGWETNNAAHAFIQVDMEEAVGRLVGLIRQHRPDVVVTYDEQGGYGHPDHIMSHRVTMAALEAAADEQRFPGAGTTWQVPKVYYSAWARSEMLRAFKIMHYLGRKTPLRDPDFDVNQWGCPDKLITTRIDVRPVLRTKWRALFSHRTQMGGRNFFWWFMRLAGRWAYPFESLRCIRSPKPVQVPESDVFQGLGQSP